MGHRTFDFSSDVGIEAEAPTVGGALVELGRAMANVITDSSPVQPVEERHIEVSGARDWTGTAVAWINELVFLFDTDQFLVADGRVHAWVDEQGVQHVQGTVRGERFDPKRHRAGRGVKAATFHDASYQVKDATHRFRLILDL